MSSISPISPVDYASPKLESAEPVYCGLTLSAWIKIGSVGALFIAIFYQSNLIRLWNKTNPFYGEANWGHAVGVPIIGLVYLFVNRDELLRAKVKTSWPGLAIIFGGFFVFAYGIWPGQNDFIKDFGMVITLFGIVQLLCGSDVMKIAWFPILFLVCAIPWPGLVYSRVAGPLQDLAAKVAVWVLQMTGVQAANVGTKIFIAGQDGAQRTLNVAEACAGLRSLMTFISVAAAVAFLSARPLWQRLTITASAIPIAILCNVIRVSGQGLLDHYVSQNWSMSFAHQFAGLVMVIPAFFVILGVGWVLDQLFIEEVDDAELLAKQEKAKPKIVTRASAAVIAASATAKSQSPTIAKTNVVAQPKVVTQPAAVRPPPKVVTPPPPPRSSVARTRIPPPRQGPAKGEV